MHTSWLIDMDVFQARERQLQRLVDAVSSPPSMRCATSREQHAVASALLLIQAQARNELVRFPFRLARGEERHEEPVELRLLMLLHEAVCGRLAPPKGDSSGQGDDDPFADAQGTGAVLEESRVSATTEQVATAAVERLMSEAYGEALERVLAKEGRDIGKCGVRVSALDLKRLCKQCGIFARSFVDGFGVVLAAEVLRSGLMRLADLVTLDVMSVMAAYHLQIAEKGGVGADAFEDGSEEQTLLKLHRRTCDLRRTLTELSPGIELGGLAGATAPVLKAWVDKTGRSIAAWIDSATAHETWTPAIEGEHHSISLVDAFASAQQAAQTFAALRMGAQPSVRTAFLELLGEACTRYIFIMREAASKEHAAKAASIVGTVGGSRGNGKSDQGNGISSLLSINAFKGDWKAMKDIIFDREENEKKDKDEVQASKLKNEEADGVISKGEELVGRMEHMAEELTSVSKWGTNLKSLGRKSMSASLSIGSASLSIGRKSLNVVTLGAVGSPGSVPAAAARGTPTLSAEASGTLTSGGDVHHMCGRDLYDGTVLVSEGGCTRMSNAAQVRQQMGAMVSILEQADQEDAAAATTDGSGGENNLLSNDWTLSPQLSAIYDRINTAVSELVTCHFQKPLLSGCAYSCRPRRWTSNCVRYCSRRMPSFMQRCRTVQAPCPPNLNASVQRQRQRPPRARGWPWAGQWCAARTGRRALETRTEVGQGWRERWVS